MSARRKALLSDYKILRAEFLGTKACCDRSGCENRPTEVHHTRGRSGSLMLDRQFWLALCSKCHRWVHDHPVKARAEGLLGPWGRQVRDDS